MWQYCRWLIFLLVTSLVYFIFSLVVFGFRCLLHQGRCFSKSKNALPKIQKIFEKNKYQINVCKVNLQIKHNDKIHSAVKQAEFINIEALQAKLKDDEEGDDSGSQTGGNGGGSTGGNTNPDAGDGPTNDDSGDGPTNEP